MPRDDAHLELAVDHTTLDGVDRCHMQVQGNVGGTFTKQGDCVTNVGHRVACRLVEQRHVKLAAHAAMDVVHAGAEHVGRSQQAQRLGVDLLTLGCQCKTSTSPAAQAQAEPGFQVLHMAADGGGSYIELQLRGRHAATVHDRLEHAQQTQVHVAQLAQNGMALYLHIVATE